MKVKMKVTQSEFTRMLQGYQIIDCVVRSHVAFHFVGRNMAEGEKAGVMSEGKVTKRAISFFDDEPKGNRVGTMDLTNFSTVFSGACKLKDGTDQVTFIDSGRQVFTRGGGFRGMESPIPVGEKGPMRGIVCRVRMIEGHLYVAGSHRSVCRRKGVNDWESFCFDLPIPTLKEHEDVKLSDAMTFLDIDGFNEADMYVVGGKGVVWHLQGKNWRQVAFPSNMYLESVCCGGDGNVYIGAQSGTIFKGRGNQWKMIHRGEMSLPFKDMVWHQNKLWCTSDYGLWTLEGDELVRADVPSEIYVCAGNLSVGDGVMLMAGTNGAAFHDGQKWQLIFNQHAMEQQVAKG